MFKSKFDRYVCDGDSITVDVSEFTVTARLVRDERGYPPWEREDGHGPVSEWTTRDKSPGERILCSDRHAKRYYDVQEAMKIARRDGWDAEPYGVGTKGERAARAVEADFEAMRRWCADEWFYVGVVLSVSKCGIVLDDHAASLWGIEANYGDDNDYLTEVANELLPEALDVAGKIMGELITCL